MKLNTRFKKIASILLIFVMLASLFPAGVIAADSITVYVTISDKGVLAEDRYGNPMGYRAVTVTDEDGDNELTIYDAYTAAHNQFCQSEFVLNGSGLVGQLWGDYSGAFLTFVNNAGISGRPLNEQSIANRSHLVGAILSDASLWSDHYSYFSPLSKTVPKSSEFELSLESFQGMSGGSAKAASGVSIGTWSGGSFSEISGKATDNNGVVSLSFDTPGTYCVTANGTVEDSVYDWSTGSSIQKNCPIIAPVCIVTVTEDKTDAEYVSEDKEALTITYTSSPKLNLPETGKSGKTKIKWTSHNTSVITDNGVITIPDHDTVVALTATITCNDAKDTKALSVNIPGRLSIAKAAVKAEALKPVEYTNATEYGYGYYSVLDDTNILMLAREIIKDDDITVAFADGFTAMDIIASDGTITYPTDEAKEITLPLKLAFKEQSEEISVTTIIPKHAQTKKEAIDAMKIAMLGYMSDPKVLNGNSSLNEVKTTLLLPSGKTSGLHISWSSSNTDVINITGKPNSTPSHPSGGKYEVKINRPNVGAANATVTLTATFVYTESSNMCGAGPMPEEVARRMTFDVIVPAVTNDEMLSILDGAASDIKITDKSGAVADLANIKDNLYFPSYEGYTTKWSTSLPIAIPDKGYDKSTVKRPEPGNNVSGTITLTLTKGETTKFKNFDATVLAWTEAELKEEQAKVQKVADALTFDEIKNKNTYSKAVTSNLNLRQSAKINGDKVTFSTYNSASYPYQIKWTITPSGTITFNNGVGKVSTPAQDTQITLTASISLKTPIAGVNAVEKPITVVVAAPHTANTNESLETLLDGIATQTTSTTNWESFMAMAAYENVRPSGAKLTDKAKQNMINSSLREISVASPGETAYSKAILTMHSIGVNPKEIYPVNSNSPVDAVAGLNGISHSNAIWTAAYTLLSYQQGDYSIGTKEEDVVEALATQLENGSWSSQETTEADATGLAIQALAAYYDKKPNVKTAIDKAIIYLSEAQLDNGGFGGTWGETANNAACVIMGLCAMGINPDTDIRFIKNGNSVLDRLLEFKSEDNSGFVYNIGDTSANAYATQQGFPALIAAYQVIKYGSAFNVYDFSSTPLSPGRATGTGTVITPSAPSGDKITVSLTIKSGTGYWLNNKSVTISGTGATVYHALIKALINSGIAQVGAESGYVESMTKGNHTLAEFANGKYSGWMYKVNGELPDAGLTEQAINDGDKIVWFYTNDWTSVPGATISFGGGETSDKKDEEKYSTDETGTNILPFNDVSNHWAYEAIKYVYSNSLMQGTSESSFSPDKTMTRAMLVTVLYRISKPESSENTHSFADVPEGQWYSDAIAWAAANGIASGVSENKFAPNEDITREQMAVILYRYAKLIGIDLSATASLDVFSDNAQISSWARDAFEWSVSAKLIGGTGNASISPKDNATRGQIATILIRFFHFIKEL